MRNTLEYPVTQEEMLKALDWAIAKYRAEQTFGGITGAALLEAKKIVERAEQIA